MNQNKTLYLKKFLAIIIFLILWQLVYVVFDVRDYIIPKPTKIGLAFIENFSDTIIFEHILTSIQRVLVGFFIASFFAIFLALFLGYYKKINEIISPIIEVLRPIPPIAWIPIAILLFGLGNNSAYFIVFLGAFFPIFTNTLFGVKSLPKIYTNISQSFGLSKIIFIKKILFYHSLPYIFEGLKIGLGMAWITVIAAELIGAQSGLGYFIQINTLMLRTDNIIVGMLLIGFINLFFNKILCVLEKKFIPWKN
jgi:ABC-type nitrate/sulfonate/bicarbonate transport system permease component